MTKRIRSLLKSASWTLAAAGAVGVGSAALAQSPAMPGRGNTAQDMQNDAPQSPADDRAHLAQMQVEVALLADPTTFPYALETQIVGSTFQVRGAVLNEAARDQVL